MAWSPNYLTGKSTVIPMSIFAQICSSLCCYYLIHLQSVFQRISMITFLYFLSPSLLALTKTHANQIKWKSISDKTSENSQWIHATYSHHISLYFLRQFYKYQPIYFSLSPMSLKVNPTLNIVPYTYLCWLPHFHRKKRCFFPLELNMTKVESGGDVIQMIRNSCSLLLEIVPMASLNLMRLYIVLYGKLTYHVN